MIECILATRGISTDVNGSWRPCCRYEQPTRQKEYKMPWMSKNSSLNDLHNSKEMIKLREALKNDIKVPECKSCWQEEDAGNISYRMNMNNYYKTNYDVDVTDEVISEPPLYLDLKLTNVCNLMCRMCGPQASSLILKEEQKLGMRHGNSRYWSQNKIIGLDNQKDFIEWLPSIETITITGGEPFVGKENRDLVQLIADEGYADKIILHFNTNGMLVPDPYLKLLEKFKRVDIDFSIDDIGKRLAYFRHGADWNKFLENWKKINHENINKKIYLTICNYNVWYALDLYKELHLNNIFDIGYDFVHNPKELNISFLNDKIKNEVIKKYENDDNKVWNKLLNFIKLDQGEDLTSKFYKHILKYDERRNENFNEVYPEWAEVINYDKYF